MPAPTRAGSFGFLFVMTSLLLVVRGRPSGHPPPRLCTRAANLAPPGYRHLAVRCVGNCRRARIRPDKGAVAPCATLRRRERLQEPPRGGRRLPVLEVR